MNDETMDEKFIIFLQVLFSQVQKSFFSFSIVEKIFRDTCVEILNARGVSEYIKARFEREILHQVL